MQRITSALAMLIGIGTILFVLMIVNVLANIFIDIFFWKLFFTLVVTAFISGKFILPNCTVIVPADRAWTMSNSFKDEDSAQLNVFEGYRQIKAQRELQAGFHWKYFWEVPNNEIDMSRKISIENDPDQTYTLKDGKTIDIKWRIFYEPLPGNIVNYTRTKPEDILRRVKDRVESFLQGYVGELNGVGFGKKEMGEIKSAFMKIYGGPEEIDKEERQLGIWTGTPEIVDIGQPKQVQDARNFQIEMETNIALAKSMVESSNGGIKFEQAMKMVLLGKGKAKIDFIELAGVLPGVGSQKH